MEIARFEFSLFGINTYIVSDPATKECAIVDPGMTTPEERNAIKDFISGNHLKVVEIINTHLHIDHAIGNEYAKETFGVGVAANSEDIPLGERMQQQALMFGLSHDVKDIRIDRHLSDGDIVKVGEGELKVITVPGHSPGGIALYDAKDGFLISGDSLFSGSVGRTDLPGGNHRTLIENLHNKLLTLPPDTIVYPGHGQPTTIGVERRSNPFL